MITPTDIEDEIVKLIYQLYDDYKSVTDNAMDFETWLFETVKIWFAKHLH